MKSPADSPTPARLSLQPILTLKVPGRLPSWNMVLAMHHWQRKKFKDRIAESFLSALHHSAADCSTKTISAKNTMWIYADTLAQFLMTRRAKSKSRSVRSEANARKS